MSFTDFLLINSGALMSWGIAFIALALVYYLVVDWFDDEQAQDWFRIVVLSSTVLMLLVMAASMFKTFYVHTERTTIDRSVGDESYQELQNRSKQGENR